MAGGRLDSETAWEMLLRHSLGFRSGKPDLLDLINWARKPKSKPKFEALTPEAASAIQEWLKRHAGNPAGLVLGAMQASPAVSIPALALACQIAFRPNPAGELIAAGARLTKSWHRGLRLTSTRTLFKAGLLLSVPRHSGLAHNWCSAA